MANEQDDHIKVNAFIDRLKQWQDDNGKMNLK